MTESRLTFDYLVFITNSISLSASTYSIQVQHVQLDPIEHELIACFFALATRDAATTTSRANNMAEPHMKTAGVPKYIRHQDDVPTNAITPTAEAAAEFKQLKMRRKYRFVLFKIDGAHINVDAHGPPSASFADFLRALPDSDCRYAVYDHEFTTSDGRKSSKLFFVTWYVLNIEIVSYMHTTKAH